MQPADQRRIRRDKYRPNFGMHGRKLFDELQLRHAWLENVCHKNVTGLLRDPHHLKSMDSMLRFMNTRPCVCRISRSSSARVFIRHQQDANRCLGLPINVLCFRTRQRPAAPAVGHGHRGIRSWSELSAFSERDINHPNLGSNRKPSVVRHRLDGVVRCGICWIAKASSMVAGIRGRIFGCDSVSQLRSARTRRICSRPLSLSKVRLIVVARSAARRICWSGQLFGWSGSRPCLA